LWLAARKAKAEVEEAYDRIDLTLAVALDEVAGFVPARRLQADVIADRIVIAESFHESRAAERLTHELSRVDEDHRYAAFLVGGGEINLASEPSGAKVSMQRFDPDADGRLVAGAETELGDTPLVSSLQMGSYMLTLRKDGFEPVTYPVLMGRQQHRTASVRLPRSGEIPEGFVYVAGGPFLYGTPDENLVENSIFAPEHEREIPSFFIARTEVTFAEWLPYFLEAPEARGIGGALKQDPRGPVIEMNYLLDDPPPLHVGELYDYRERRLQPKRADWTRWPVAGISFDEARAFAAWRAEKQHAAVRLCDEAEWEKAARGADGRTFPQGDHLGEGDASVALENPHRVPKKRRWVDEVSSFPASRTVYGVDDAVGNVAEWTQSADDVAVLRSSNWGQFLRLELWNRELRAPAWNGVDVGVRLCIEAK
jgi:formylglycine-generating enzyme required for sulfatase activity